MEVSDRYLPLKKAGEPWRRRPPARTRVVGRVWARPCEWRRLAGQVPGRERSGLQVGVHLCVDAGVAVLAVDAVGDGSAQGEQTGSGHQLVHGLGASVGSGGVAGGGDDQCRDPVGDPGRLLAWRFGPEGTGGDVVGDRPEEGVAVSAALDVVPVDLRVAGGGVVTTDDRGRRADEVRVGAAQDELQ